MRVSAQMTTNKCKVCGIDWQGHMRGEVCARCQEPGNHERHSLADAPPLSTNEIEDIKVKMQMTGWVWKE